jgi:DNA polymerase-1
MERVLIVDASPLIYSNYSKLSHIKSSKGEPTGVRYGFIRSIKSLQVKTRVDRVIICYDSKGSIDKAEGVSEYKANRVETQVKKDMYSQIDDLKALLSLTRWAQVEKPGVEADDIVATLARKEYEKGHKVIIFSVDEDFLQLICNRPCSSISVAVKINSKLQIRDDSFVIDKYGVRPSNLLYLRSLKGDTSDNLKSVGLKSSTLAHIIKVLDGVPEGLNLQELGLYVRCKCDSEMQEELLSVEDKILRNQKVMTLYNIDDLYVKEGLSDLESLTKLFEELEFKSLIQHINLFL